MIDAVGLTGEVDCLCLGKAAVDCRLRSLVVVVDSWSLSLPSVHGSHPVTISGAVFDLFLFN